MLELLIDHLPPQVHLVLSARFDPPLPLVRWSAKGQLNDLRAADLRFTLEETHAFLTRLLGNTLAHETVVVLEEQTEGWIAVLRLAALSLRSAANRAAFLERLRHAPDRSVSRYLLEEILSQQAPFVQEVLLRISILEQFCVEVCVALLGEETSRAEVQATLDWLEGANLFLVSLDERQGWYRLHHLFQGLLQQRLRERSSAEELAILHRRASAWYAAQGLLDEALHHALAAGDAREAAHLVEAHFLPAFEQDQWRQMERWLRLLPEEQIQVSPGLLVARVWVSWIRGQLQGIPPLLIAAERLVAASGSELPDQSDSPFRLLHALIAMFWSHIQYFTGQPQPSLHNSQAALELLRPGEEYVASWVLSTQVRARQAAGQEEEALAELQQALRAWPARPAITVRLIQTQAAIYATTGKFPQLEHAARHYLRLAQEADLALTQNWAQWALGVVSYEWNQLDAAVYHFSAVLADRHRAHTWTVQEALCGLAFAYQAQGMTTRAHETTEALLDWLQGQHNLPRLLTAYSFCGQLALMRGEVEEAAQWLELVGEHAVAGQDTFFEDPPITRARLLLARGDQASVAQGQALLDELVQHLEAIHHTPKLIKVLALRAYACELQERPDEVLDALERALALARPGGFVRTFVDLPPMARLLQEVRKRRKAQQAVNKALDAYLQRLLAALGPGAAAGMAPDELLRQEGLEPLTERERHILGLLEQELTNKEIARALVVTPGTVKVHTNNLYRKLSVNNRRAAVTLAKALGLLPSEQAPTPQMR
ncbi:MAG: LuxR C-terminal-related transcriptional regulator [Ktedonobacteraceae bacterium]